MGIMLTGCVTMAAPVTLRFAEPAAPNSLPAEKSPCNEKSLQLKNNHNNHRDS